MGLFHWYREWEDVSKEAIKNKTKVHVGKIFEICVEKGSELPLGDPMRKFKGRTVFQGNNVAADVDLFAELASSPASMEAGKALDASGAMPGNKTIQGDGLSANSSFNAGNSDLDQITPKSMAQRMDWSIQRPSFSSFFGFVWAS